MSIVVRRLGRFPKREPGLCNEVFVCSLCLSLSTRGVEPSRPWACRAKVHFPTALRGFVTLLGPRCSLADMRFSIFSELMCLLVL